MPNVDSSFLGYFLQASLVVKLVMLLLFGASILSWTIIFYRGFFLKRTKAMRNEFEKKFWASLDLSKLYTDLNHVVKGKKDEGLAYIFHTGFHEFIRLHKQVGSQPAVIMEGVQRAMRIAYAQQHQRLEEHLDFLATLGSTSPYIGLFGTVWGIMTSFQALSASHQTATIAMVAPGISEALIATAMGLFVAIPAVVFYNRYASQIQHLLHQYHTFQEEFSNILYRKIHGNNNVSV